MVRNSTFSWNLSTWLMLRKIICFVQISLCSQLGYGNAWTRLPNTSSRTTHRCEKDVVQLPLPPLLQKSVMLWDVSKAGGNEEI